MKRWQKQLATAMICSAPLGACSDAGGAADDLAFTPVGVAGSPSASAGSGGAPSLGGSGGGAGEASTSPSFVDTPGDVTREPDAGAETVFPEAPSCDGSSPVSCDGESCCQQEAVDTSEVMLVAANAGVSLSPFALDKFEVTVGRFRKFVTEYNDWRQSGNPAAGAGAHPHTEGSGWNTDPTWEVQLAGAAAVLRVGLNCNATQQTWTDEPGVNENKPINCINWFEALAFCAWDEGRLPTEAEWQYAAVGGAQGRTFAWGNTPLMDSFATYGCRFAGTASTCSVDDIPEVGSKPDGNGRFGHADLVGSIYEWTLDWFANYPEALRDDYAKTDTGTGRMLRGGAWNSTTEQILRSNDRSFHPAPTFRDPRTGLRCARDLPEPLPR